MDNAIAHELQEARLDLARHQMNLERIREVLARHEAELASPNSGYDSSLAQAALSEIKEIVG